MLDQRVAGMLCSKSQLILVGQIEVVDGEHDGAYIIWGLRKAVCNRRHLRQRQQ